MCSVHARYEWTHLGDRAQTAFRIPSSKLITSEEIAAQSVPKTNQDFQTRSMERYGGIGY
jgi:hypothetical protein